jgi:hypothetical protein
MSGHVPFVPPMLSQPMYIWHQPPSMAHYIQTQPLGMPPALIALPSVYQLRASDALAMFDEHMATTIGDYAIFDLHITCCNTLANILLGSHNAKALTEVFRRGAPPIILEKLRLAARRFHIRVTDDTLDEIFHDEGRPGRRSCRKLRNGMDHGMHRDHMAEILWRHAELIEHMATFIAAVRSRSDGGHLF